MEDETILLYAITATGPDIIFAKSKLSREKLQEIALYHLLLVAQGTWHHKGLFLLPIPVKEINETSKAIFYGFTVYDPNQHDPRTNHTRYGCIITFCSNDALAKLDLIDIQDKLDELLKSVNSYQELKKKKFFSALTAFVNEKIALKKKIELNYVE